MNDTEALGVHGIPVLEWHLHASALDTGEPLFPYHQLVDGMLMGLQYDLDETRVLGMLVPYWADKKNESVFQPGIQIFTVNSLHLNDVTVVQSHFAFNLTTPRAPD